MQLDDAVSQFLLAMRADGLKAATIDWYASILRSFVNATDKQVTESVTTQDLRAYIVSLREQDARYVDADQRPEIAGGFSKATINSHIRGLHRFWKWAAVEFGLKSNPMENIKRPKPITPVVKAISDRDFVKLFNATSDDMIGMRDRAILAFLADTGCRSGGLLSLTIGDLHLERRYAVVYEKYDKTRKAFFTRVTAHLLEQWLRIRPRSTDDVFISMNTGEALTNSGLNQLRNRLKKKAGVKGRVNPHSYRHAFARSYLQNGGDLVTLSRLLGHSDITVTSNYYAIFDDDELQNAHEKHSPLTNLEISIEVDQRDD